MTVSQIAADKFEVVINDPAGFQKREWTLVQAANELQSLTIEFGKPRVASSGEDAMFSYYSDATANRLHTTVTVFGASADAVRKAWVDDQNARKAAKRRQEAARCPRCNGTGVYVWGTIVNGVPSHSGVCFRCNGNGVDPYAGRPVSPAVEKVEDAVAVVEDAPVADAFEVPEGTYTLVFEDGSYKTFRVRVKEFGRGTVKTPKTVVEYLSGPDNELNFEAFAFINYGARTTVNVWKRFERGPLVAFAREIETVLTRDGRDGLAEAGHAYALKSNRCFRCGRTLTVPASINRGLGPDCAGKAGF